jgi:hypothetical protein
MAKKLLSEAQVRKFMGLANLDANLSSNFLNEMYGEPAKRDEEEKMEEAKHEDEMKEEKHDDEKKVMKEEEDEMEMDAEADMDMDMDAAPEGGDIEGDADVELDEDEVAEAKSAMEKVQAVLDKLMAGGDGEPEMDDMAAEEPPMDDMAMDDEPEMMSEVELELTEDEIVQEVARRVAKRINEAARAQKKADKLLGRKKK